MVATFKQKLEKVVGVGKRALHGAIGVGKKIYKAARTAVPIAQKVGDIAAKYGGALAVIPEFGPQLAQGVTSAGAALSRLAGVGNSLLDKGDAAYDKGASIYNAIKGEAARQGLTFGSSDVSGIRTTPPNWSSAHESKSNKTQKNFKPQPVTAPPSAPIAPGGPTEVSAPAAEGSKMATGPMVGMSSEYAADSVAQEESKKRKRDEKPSEVNTMYDRYLALKKAKTG